MGARSEIDSEAKMPPKLDKDSATGRVNVIASETLLKRVNEWRRRHPAMPNKSEAIRMLVEMALDAEERKGRR